MTMQNHFTPENRPAFKLNRDAMDRCRLMLASSILPCIPDNDDPSFEALALAIHDDNEPENGADANTCRELVELAQELIEAGSMTEKRAERINQSIENLTGVPITYPLIEVTTQSDQPPSNEEFLHVHEDGTASLHDHPQHYGDEPHDPEMKPLHLQLGILADRIAHLAPNESELAADASWSKTPLGRISCEIQALADNQREVATNG